ncbi:MAG: autotransporter-associated beta strand repeat-containing protein [Planctomycetia bacterium]|nr:autotransporter-associated beta strand repeat-containing protein [Planctomycetia bacterium]
MKNVIYSVIWGMLILGGSAQIGNAQNPNAILVDSDTSMTFAGLNLSDRSYSLVKTGAGTLTMTDALGNFMSADGTYMDVEILEGKAVFNVSATGELRNNLTIGGTVNGVKTSATLQVAGKAFGEHGGNVTINNDSVLNIAGGDTTMADYGGTILFNGSGSIMGNTFHMRARNGKQLTVRVTGTESHASIAQGITLVEGDKPIILDVQDKTSTLTFSGSIVNLNAAQYRNQGFEKTGAGTVVFENHNTFTSSGVTVKEGGIQLGGKNNGSSTVGYNFLTLNAGTTGTAVSDNVFGKDDDAKIPDVTINGTFTAYGTTNLKTLMLNNGTVNQSADGNKLVFTLRSNAEAQKIASTGTSVINPEIVVNANTEAVVTSGTLTVKNLSGGATLKKTGTGTLNITQNIASTFKGTLHIAEGIASMATAGNEVNRINYVIGSETTTAMLNMAHKSLGDHYGAITIYDGSTLKTATDATLADSNTITFAGGGAIISSRNDGYVLFRNRTAGKSSDIVVTGANADALFQSEVFWFVETSGTGVNFDVQEVTSTLTVKGYMFNHGGNGGGFTKKGDGTLVLSLGDNKDGYNGASTNTDIHQLKGAVKVEAGTLKLGSDNGISTRTASVTLADGAVLDLAGYDQSLGMILGTGNVVNTGTEESTLTLGAIRNFYTRSKTPDSTELEYVSSTFSANTGEGVKVVAEGEFKPVGATIADTLELDGTLVFDLALLGNEDSALTVGAMNFGEMADVDILFDENTLNNFDVGKVVTVTETENIKSVFDGLSNLLEDSSFGYYFDLVQNGNVASLSLNHGAVPEPAAWILLVCGFVGFGFLRRK